MCAIMVMFDSLNRKMLSPYGCDWTKTPNFAQLEEKALMFDTCFVGSMPCMPARRELHTGRYNFLYRSWGRWSPLTTPCRRFFSDEELKTIAEQFVRMGFEKRELRKSASSKQF